MAKWETGADGRMLVSDDARGRSYSIGKSAGGLEVEMASNQGRARGRGLPAEKYTERAEAVLLVMDLVNSPDAQAKVPSAPQPPAADNLVQLKLPRSRRA